MLDEEKIQRLDGPVRENNPEVVPTRSAWLRMGYYGFERREAGDNSQNFIDYEGFL